MTDLTLTFSFAMSFHVQKSVCGMIFPHGVNVIKTVVEEPNIEPVLFTKKLNLAESHAKVMQRRNVFATKPLVQ